jgi:Ca2+-transporting ATPase
MVNLSLFHWALHSGRSLQESMTMTFVSLVLIQFFKAYCFRSASKPLFHRPLANRWLNAAVAWELALLAFVITAPFLREAFSTFSLTSEDWLIVLFSSFTVIPAIEAVKLLIRKGVIRR